MLIARTAAEGRRSVLTFGICEIPDREDDMPLKSVSLLPLAVVLLLLTGDVAGAQPKPSPARRLRTPATVRGFIGGESHDNYVIRARKGQTLTVHLSWRREGDNQASFNVRDSPDYYTGEPVKFGTASDGGRQWVGRIPRSGDYYIDVVAHPAARYTLRVRLK
jgi:hypothetical protein